MDGYRLAQSVRAAGAAVAVIAGEIVAVGEKAAVGEAVIGGVGVGKIDATPPHADNTLANRVTAKKYLFTFNVLYFASRGWRTSLHDSFMWAS